VISLIPELLVQAGDPAESASHLRRG